MGHFEATMMKNQQTMTIFIMCQFDACEKLRQCGFKERKCNKECQSVFKILHTLMSCLMRKPTICISMRKQRRRSASQKLMGAFVFATWIVQFLYFLNPKFPFSSHLLCMYSSVCVRPNWKPHRWFSHETAHFMNQKWPLFAAV